MRRMVLLEVLMRPSASERIELTTIFVLMAAGMALGAQWLPRQARRMRSLRSTFAMLSLFAFSIVALGALAIANRMFLSTHDLTLLLIVVAFGVLAAIGFALTVGRPLSRDLETLSTEAVTVATGSLDRTVAIDRQDEVGRLGAALDSMIARLDAAVGHDLRTPLSSMKAALEALQDGVVNDSKRYLASMSQDVEALTSLVDDVFLLAHLDAGSFDIDLTTVDVTEVVDEAIKALTPLALDRELSLRLDASNRAVATASSKALGRVIRNLIDNAIRHAPRGTSVVVDVAHHAEKVRVRVTDQGEGFSADFVPVAFHRFTRADTARMRGTGGAGLGLAIAGELVLAMHGRVWAEPGPGGQVILELVGADPDSTPTPVTESGRLAPIG